MIVLVVLLASVAKLHLTADELRSITSRCGVPNGWFELRNDGAVRIKLPADAAYAKVDCALRGMRKYSPPMSFIGNEQSR